MPDSLRWELPSNSGREVGRWSVTALHRERGETTLCCDVELEGRFFGEAPAMGSPHELQDYHLVIHGLYLRRSELSRLVRALRDWLDLPPERLRDHAFEWSGGMGGSSDQHVRLTFGQREDVLSDGHPVATVEFAVGRLSGELSYPTDQSCLRLLVEGVEYALANAGDA